MDDEELKNEEKVYPESAIEDSNEPKETELLERKRKMREQAASEMQQSMMFVYAGPEYFSNRKFAEGLVDGPGMQLKPEQQNPAMMLVYAAPPLPNPFTNGQPRKPSKNGDTCFCSQCGAKIPRTSRFCPYCGSRNILYGGNGTAFC